LQLRDFPFDTQKLGVTMVVANSENGSVILTENAEKPSRINDSFSISDWKTVGWKSSTDIGLSSQVKRTLPLSKPPSQ
jgi:hypothetical protein